MSKGSSYEVFLSFTGSDTRKGFGELLYTILTTKFIRVFWDEEELERGKEIDKGLVEAIEQSKISIPIISKDYASSKSCLMELIQMLECKDKKEHIIIPIFYHVDQSDVRHCNGTFARSLLGHQECGIDGKLIDSWKSALHRVAKLSGYHLNQTSKMTHGKLMMKIVREVQQKLNKENLLLPKQLVGVDPHVQDIMAKLKIDFRNGHAVKLRDTPKEVLVIYGLAGAGKTVLAKYVYNQLHHLFDACSFLGDIKEKIKDQDIVSVQNKLISDLHKGYAQKLECSDKAHLYIQDRFRNMKVLILLDDVNDHEELSNLVGVLDWLGWGSRVILTSQTKDVVRNIEGAESFLLGPMKQDDALKLFCRHAFGMDSPPEKFKNLSIDIAVATGGLPLVLQVVGSSLLSVKLKKAWSAQLTALKVDPYKGVQAALKKSYDNLCDNEQKIFLDIACFFIGKDKRIPYQMWDACKYSPYDSLLSLHARSLVEIGEDKELCMHEILKNFGREIVKNENKKKPYKRSRLWDPKEALDVLKRRKGTRKVEALTLEFGDGSKGNITFECELFDGLQKLRFLKLDQANIQGNFGDRLSSLRWLDWQGCPKILDVQSLNLNLQNLVILDLSWSQVFKDWTGWKLLEEARKLKVLKLTGCVQLIATPNFPASMELERLILEDCSRLEVTTLSFRNLTRLVSLNMKQCNCLYEWPDLGPMGGLKELVIDGTSVPRIDPQESSMSLLKILSARDCKKLNEISDSIRYLESLTHLALDSTEIHSLPESIGSLERLKTLSLKNCRSLSRLPDGIGKILSLQLLDLSDTVIQKLPPSVKDLKAMKVLRMRGTFIREFPKAILNLNKLEEIDFSSCRSLKGKIHHNIWRLSSLVILKLSRTQISGLPASFHRLSHLQELDVFGCDNLQSLPMLPASLINVRRDFNQ